MINPSTFRDIVSGRRSGVAASLLRGVLRVCETPYRAAMRWRNRRFDRGIADVVQAGVPVICVGNLSLGGTGKTPLVQWLCQFLRQHPRRVAIVSRGYGKGDSSRNDEALELELALPDVPHLQNVVRAEAAAVAVDELEMEAIVLDDGFQHRQLHRDLDIVLLDATEPFGFEHVFPRGTLREPIEGLARADVVVLSRADVLEPSARSAVRERVATIAPDALWCEVRHSPRQLLNSRGATERLESIAGKRVAAFCAVGNPTGFRHTLESLQANVVAWREFPDHHRYDRADVESLTSWALAADCVLCTRKDLVKLQVANLAEKPLWAVEVAIEFLAGQSELEQRVKSVVSVEVEQ